MSRASRSSARARSTSAKRPWGSRITWRNWEPLRPTSCSTSRLTSVVRLAYVLVPKLRRVSEENLTLAYPDHDATWRAALLERSYGSLGRVLVDFARLPSLDAAWVAAHIEFPAKARFEELMRSSNGKGLLIATGHLGSFELLAHCAPLHGHPMSFVVRNSKLPRVDAWWRAMREANGNQVISRKGAFREVVQRLESGQNVGVLFDQNVRAKHAVFVDWFGRKAATTKTVALAALRTECRVAVAGVRYLGDERYSIEYEDFNFEALYRDGTVTADEKVYRMTAQLAASYQKIIERSPHEWFWMHRRWRTRPEAVK
ncbi:MAG: hypothetical protein EBZ48_01795 [Proteobacteria bacterium]|nr:hypothetical protein [Pseudomonadota bacterium]